eukprot:6852663-Lingulodinium_polyedra.AAC.1
MLLNSLKRVISVSVPSGLQGLHLVNHTRVNGKIARALGVVKALARKVSEVGNQIPPNHHPP